MVTLIVKLEKLIDLRKFVLKTEFTEIRVFEKMSELFVWQRDQSMNLKISHSDFVKCSLNDCDDNLHKMRIQFMHCECCK